MLSDITPLVLTLNEEANIGRTLASLSWATDVVIVDSGSSDRTTEIARSFANVRVVQRPFTTHAEQWNFGLNETGIKTEWVLALDADFLLSDAVVAELRALSPGDTAGFTATFVYCVNGAPLRSGVYPPVTVLYRRASARYEQDGHTQRVAINGRVERLRQPILHDDRKPLGHWLQSQVRYMRLEADKLTSAPASALSGADRVRQWIAVAPLAVFCYCLFVRGGILDGWRGWWYATQRMVAEAILSMLLIERRLAPPDR
ncbi:MAG TPA: glycosyltransferase family 2 protein [Vicinamibacterales bacterium]|nr:glycosyltransferase family 2 protein [Vicinamibacterales bacterium]